MQPRKHVRWTLDEVSILRKLYPYYETARLQDALPGRSIGAILGKASELGIRKDEEDFTLAGPEEETP